MSGPGDVDWIGTNVDATATPLTVESLTKAMAEINERAWEPHRHLFNPRATRVDGIYHCVDCGAAYEWRNGQPVLEYPA